jgi:hypothetical protein
LSWVGLANLIFGVPFQKFFGILAKKTQHRCSAGAKTQADVFRPLSESSFKNIFDEMSVSASMPNPVFMSLREPQIKSSESTIRQYAYTAACRCAPATL